jgi:hypothetical protein
LKPTEEPRTPAEITQDAEAARQVMVGAAALSALTASGCLDPKLLLPHVASSLAAIAPGAGDPVRILAVSEDGSVRTGPRGPMGPDEVIAELLREHPSWRRYWP